MGAHPFSSFNGPNSSSASSSASTDVYSTTTTSSSASTSSASSTSDRTSAYAPSLFPLGWPSIGGVGAAPLLGGLSSIAGPATAGASLSGWSASPLQPLQPQQPQHGFSGQPRAVPQRVLQVMARLPGLGAVSVCVEAGSKVQDLIMCIETQVWGVYGVPVEVRKLSDLLSIDLAPSYEVGKVLDDDDPIVHAHFRRLDTHPLPSPSSFSSSTPPAIAKAVRDVSSSSASSSSSSSPRPHWLNSSSPITIPANSSSSSSSSTSSSSTSPSSLSPRLQSVRLTFVEPPPTKVLQNKEFCFTVAFAFPSGTSEEAAQVWRSPGAGKLLKVTVACEAGEVVPEQNFTLRMMVMEGKDMIGVFGRLRVNSYYGRKRYLIRVVCADPGWRSNTLTSDPVTVLSKKCKHRSKRAKDKEADDGESAEADVADQHSA